VEEMTFSTQGPLFIPGILYGQRLGDWIRNWRERVSRNLVDLFPIASSADTKYLEIGL
jgi:hypothetical protein